MYCFGRTKTGCMLLEKYTHWCFGAQDQICSKVLVVFYILEHRCTSKPILDMHTYKLTYLLTIVMINR
jgi:hypothetical protein